MSEPSTLDLLMQRVEEINHKTPPLSADDITIIIAYHRNARQRKANGEKVPRTAKSDTAKVMAQLDNLMASTPKVLSKPKFTLKSKTQ